MISDNNEKQKKENMNIMISENQENQESEKKESRKSRKPKEQTSRKKWEFKVDEELDERMRFYVYKMG